MMDQFTKLPHRGSSFVDTVVNLTRTSSHLTCRLGRSFAPGDDTALDCSRPSSCRDGCRMRRPGCGSGHCEGRASGGSKGRLATQ